MIMVQNIMQRYRYMKKFYNQLDPQHKSKMKMLNFTLKILGKDK